MHTWKMSRGENTNFQPFSPRFLLERFATFLCLFDKKWLFDGFGQVNTTDSLRTLTKLWRLQVHIYYFACKAKNIPFVFGGLLWTVLSFISLFAQSIANFQIFTNPSKIDRVDCWTFVPEAFYFCKMKTCGFILQGKTV